MTPSRTIAFIVVTIFIDAVGFGIIMPVLPRLGMGARLSLLIAGPGSSDESEVRDPNF